MITLRLQKKNAVPTNQKKPRSYQAKQGGQYTLITPATPMTHDYFLGVEWKRLIRISEALHRAANARLDRTIESLGRERFQQALDRNAEAQRHISENCVTDELTPCSNSSGPVPRKNICIDRDMGGGFDCIDKVADELGLPEYDFT